MNSFKERVLMQLNENAGLQFKSGISDQQRLAWYVIPQSGIVKVPVKNIPRQADVEDFIEDQDVATIEDFKINPKTSTTSANIEFRLYSYPKDKNKLVKIQKDLEVAWEDY